MAKIDLKYLYAFTCDWVPRPRRAIEMAPAQVAPVLHLAARWRGDAAGSDRIVFDHMFWLMLEGEMFLKMDGETTRAGPYELLLVPPFVPNQEIGGPGVRAFIGVHFDLAYGVPDSGVLRERAPYEVTFSEGAKLQTKYTLSPSHPIVTLAESLPLVMVPPSGQLAMECNTTLHSILTQLFRISGGNEVSRARQSKQNALIARAVLYAQEHCRKEVDLSVEDLAEVADLSRSRFEYLFRMETGFAPMAFVRKLRIDHAKMLLAEVERTIKEVALASGYRESFGFSRAFKKVVGCSPTEFRNQKTGQV